MRSISLPIDPYLGAIVEAAVRDRGIVVVAEPGAGKTTRVPPALLDALTDRAGKVVLVQPRRVAARTTAYRLAAERGEPVGQTCGYRVRFDRKEGPATRLLVVTDGVLLRWLQSDPFLDGVAAVVLDEFHERRVQTDLAAAMLREVRDDARDDLLTVVMSATIEPGPVADYFGCTSISVPGRTFPLRVEHGRSSAVATEVDVAAAEAVQSVMREMREAGDDGHVLVFLDGIGAIRRTAERLRKASAGGGPSIHVLHGSLPLDEQQRALAPSATPKVILSTNIAETSLTVDGVTAVVDSGFQRVMRYDATRGFDRLRTERISKASAAQRAGRAGRTAPGRVRRLWTGHTHVQLPADTEPELRAVDLAPAIVEVLAWGADPHAFGWFDPPSKADIDEALDRLWSMGLLVGREPPRLSTEAELSQQLPLPPRLGLLAVRAARSGAMDEGVSLAVWLAEGATTAHSPSDPESGVLAGAERVRQGRGGDRALRASFDSVRRILERKVRTEGARRGVEWALVHSFRDRLARRRPGATHDYLLTTGRGVRLSDRVQGYSPEWIVVLEVASTAGRRRAPSAGSKASTEIRASVQVHSDLVEEVFAPEVVSEETMEWDGRTGRAYVVTQRRLDSIVLSESRRRATVSAETSQLVAVAIQREPSAIRAILLRQQSQWLHRFEWSRRTLADDERSTLELIAACASALADGATAISEISPDDIRVWLQSESGSAHPGSLERRAPVSLALASGRRAAIRYDDSSGRPTVAGRVQEFFGMTVHPTVAGGVALRVELLAPNGRPAQITDDLPGFWSGAYAAVRKDLRGRYPKHHWPEDPATARYVRPGRRRSES